MAEETVTRTFNVVDVGVIDPDGQLARFKLTFYGVPFEDFMRSGERIRRALEQRNLNGYISSPFLIRLRGRI